MSSHGSSHADKHPYLRPEMWVRELVFWNTPYHKKEKYADFHQRQINEAGRMNKSAPQNNSYYKVRAVEKKENPVEVIPEPTEESAMPTKRCKRCEKNLPVYKFSIVKGQSRYKKKDGTEKIYNTTTQRHICKKCTWLTPRRKEGQQFVIGGIRIY